MAIVSCGDRCAIHIWAITIVPCVPPARLILIFRLDYEYVARNLIADEEQTDCPGDATSNVVTFNVQFKFRIGNRD